MGPLGVDHFLKGGRKVFRGICVLGHIVLQTQPVLLPGQGLQDTAQLDSVFRTTLLRHHCNLISYLIVCLDDWKGNVI